MAFSFDTSLYFTGTANPLTTNYTCGANAKLLVLDIGTEVAVGGIGRYGGTPSYGGRYFTNINVSAGTGGEAKIEMFALENPSTGAAYSTSIPNTGGIILNCHLSSYNVSSGYSVKFDSSINLTTASGLVNVSTNIITPSAGALIVAAEGNGSSSIMVRCFPGNRITPFLDKGACQNESQWYVTPSTANVSIGFTNGSTPGISGMVVGVWKEIAPAASRTWGGILKYWNGDSWKECPSTKFKIYNGSSWITVPVNKFKIWRDDPSAAWYPIRFDGSMGTAVDVQNLLKYSEQLDNAAWTGDLTVSTNTGVDLDGNTTLDTLTASGAFQTRGQDFITVAASTEYAWSFDAIRGTQGTTFYVQFYDNSNDAVITTVDFYSSTSASVQRVTMNFTSPAGCTNITPFFMWAASGDNMKIGRVQLALPGKAYVETTDTPVL